MSLTLDQILAAFRDRYGRAPEAVARAPGRLNLIGDHTDYNEGLVLPLALPQAAWCAAAGRSDGVIAATSLAAQDEQRWALHASGAAGLAAWGATQRPHWTSYVAGVVELLRDRGAWISGCDLLIHGSVPLGAGLASSAALCVSVAKTLIALTGEPVETSELARLCQAAEHRYAGVPCGIMDPLVCLAALPEHALLINCRSLRCEPVPGALPGHRLVVIDSGERHELASGEYALRRQQCAEAVAYFQRTRPELRALCDIEPELVRSHASQMPPLAAARAQHVVSEQQRVLAAVAALRAADATQFGRLLNESHRSLRDEFEASTPWVETLREALLASPGVCGARLTGGGFGGCLLAVVAEDTAGELRALAALLVQRSGRSAHPAFEARACGGATIELG